MGACFSSTQRNSKVSIRRMKRGCRQYRSYLVDMISTADASILEPIILRPTNGKHSTISIQPEIIVDASIECGPKESTVRYSLADFKVPKEIDLALSGLVSEATPHRFTFTKSVVFCLRNIQNKEVITSAIMVEHKIHSEEMKDEYDSDSEVDDEVVFELIWIATARQYEGLGCASLAFKLLQRIAVIKGAVALIVDSALKEISFWLHQKNLGAGSLAAHVLSTKTIKTLSKGLDNRHLLYLNNAIRDGPFRLLNTKKVGYTGVPTSISRFYINGTKSKCLTTKMKFKSYPYYYCTTAVAHIWFYLTNPPIGSLQQNRSEKPFISWSLISSNGIRNKYKMPNGQGSNSDSDTDNEISTEIRQSRTKQTLLGNNFDQGRTSRCTSRRKNRNKRRSKSLSHEKSSIHNKTTRLENESAFIEEINRSKLKLWKNRSVSPTLGYNRSAHKQKITKKHHRQNVRKTAILPQERVHQNIGLSKSQNCVTPIKL